MQLFLWHRRQESINRGEVFSPLALGHLEAPAGKLGWAATPTSTGSQGNGLLQAAKCCFQPSLKGTRLMEKLLLINAWSRGQFTQNFCFSTGIFLMLIIIKTFKHFWKTPAWVPSNKILLVSLHKSIGISWNKLPGNLPGIFISKTNKILKYVCSISIL